MEMLENFRKFCMLATSWGFSCQTRKKGINFPYCFPFVELDFRMSFICDSMARKDGCVVTAMSLSLSLGLGLLLGALLPVHRAAA